MIDFPSIIDRVSRASKSELVVQAFETALGDVGADYFGAILLPRPDQPIEDVVLARKVPSEWRELAVTDERRAAPASAKAVCEPRDFQSMGRRRQLRR